MRFLPFFLGAALTIAGQATVGCFDAIPVGVDANGVCYYEDIVVFTGQLSLDGTGLEGFEDQLSGEWTFYKTPEEREDARTRCEIRVPHQE